MDQKELRELEKRCIQEQPPECTATCPIHLDVRSLVKEIGQGNWDQAWKGLYRTMPFPGILGRICDHPCQTRCLRGQAGDPIRIGLLEQACVSMPAPPRRIQPFPAKDRKTLIVGSGLGGLTAAWDLARKGYRVTLLEPAAALGDSLLHRYAGVLTREIIDGELSVLDKLGITVHLNRKPDDLLSEDDLPGDFDAVILSFDAVDKETFHLESDRDGRPLVEPLLRTTGRPGVFAAGLNDSPVRQAAEGRWAATSVDRFLQKVSMTAGREKDAPFQTTLFTSLKDIPAQPAVPVSNPANGYTPEEAMAEARRCIQCECLECVKVCPYLEHFGSYPKKYAREIYNNASIVMGSRQANKLINSCSLCGLCETVCPNDFAMQDLCLQARQDMVDRDKMPPSAHEFALLDMAFSQSDRFALARHQPGEETSRHLFFPGCQLASSAPKQVEQVYRHLCSVLSDGVGLMLGCCGAPAFWSGRQKMFDREMASWRDKWEEWGRPEIITACSTCFRTFKDHWPEANPVSLWQVFDETDCPPEAWRPQNPVALHDPCTTRHEPGIQDSVRRMLDRLNIPLEELELSRDKTECCGFGGLMQNANPDMAKEVIRRRSEESGLDYMAYCAMCRDSLAGVGKRAMHLLDLFFPLEGESDPAARKRPGWSQRQENRARLKTRLIKEIWQEDFGFMEEHQTIRLILSSEVQTLLDERRILVEDLQKTVLQAEKTGQRFRHPGTGRYKASFKPYKATFWIEYTPRENGFEIHNAYAHRMEVVKGVNREK